MKSELLAGVAKSPLLALPLFALFLFVGIFFFVLVATMKKKASAYEPLARLALEDGSPSRTEEPDWTEVRLAARATPEVRPAALAMRGRDDGGER